MRIQVENNTDEYNAQILRNLHLEIYKIKSELFDLKVNTSNASLGITVDVVPEGYQVTCEAQLPEDNTLHAISHGKDMVKAAKKLKADMVKQLKQQYS